MEIISINPINTSTQLSVQSNTALAAYLYNRDPLFQYVSTGYNNDATTTSIVISFASTQTIDRIAMVNHNLKSFTMFYNGATANTFALTTTADTTVSNYTSNSSTSQYWRTTQVFATSVTLDLKSTIVANAEKAIGYFYVGNLTLDFARDPDAASYKPLIDPKQVKHELSDGGIRIHQIANKQTAQIKYKYITETFRNSLKTIYDSYTPFVFAPFGTTTSWDGIFFEAVWPGTFDFFRYSDDAPSSGFSGTINLEETPV